MRVVEGAEPSGLEPGAHEGLFFERPRANLHEQSKPLQHWGELVLHPKLDNIANAYGVKEGSDVPKNGSSAQIGQSANFKFKRSKKSRSEA